MSYEDLAKAIADRLFVNGSGGVAERLVLVTKEIGDLGGWSKGAVKDVIAEEMDKEAEAIVDKLFTNNKGTVADHLVLTSQGLGYLGSWNREGVKAAILEEPGEFERER